MRRRISRTTRPALRSERTLARGRRTAGVAASVPYDEWLGRRLKDPREAAAYLDAAIAAGDQGALMLALRRVAQAQGGVAEIARKAKLTREATYRMLSKGGNPELRSLNALLAATGFRLAVTPIAARSGRQRLPP